MNPTYRNELFKEGYVKILFWHDAISGNDIESAWAKKVGEHYQLDNILFYAREYACGDILEAEEKEGELLAGDVITESGHSTIRILVADINNVPEVFEKINSWGCAWEQSNIPRLIAVDVPPEVSYKELRNHLLEEEEKGFWEIEEGCLSAIHRSQLDENQE